MLISRIAYEPVVLNGRSAFDSSANYSGAISVALIIPEASSSGKIIHHNN